MVVAAVLSILSLVQASIGAPPSSPAPTDTAEATAVDSILEVCLVGLAASHTPAEYAANSDEAARDFMHQHPSVAGVEVGGYDGRACRVRYTGPNGGQVFVALTGMTAVNGCEQASSTDVLIRARCALPDGGPAGDIEVIRPQAVDSSPITATIVYLPGTASAAPPPPTASTPVPTARP